MLRRALGPGPTLVVPGIRPAGTARDDQERVMTLVRRRWPAPTGSWSAAPITGAPTRARRRRRSRPSLRLRSWRRLRDGRAGQGVHQPEHRGGVRRRGGSRADWVGFVFFPPSPRFVTPARAARQRADARRPAAGGCCVEPTEAMIAEVLAMQLDVLPGAVDPAVERILAFGVPRRRGRRTPRPLGRASSSRGRPSAARSGWLCSSPTPRAPTTALCASI